MDRHSKEQRSRNMSAVKSKNNLSTEKALGKIFRKMKVKGWRRQNTKIFGKPDFIFNKQRIAIFIDGCFWHGCKEYNSIPKTNRRFWTDKINKNILRDKLVSKNLKKAGWKVLRVWEHEIRQSPDKCLNKIYKLLSI